MADYPERECLFCKKKFSPKKPNQVCCSAECQLSRKKDLSQVTKKIWDEKRKKYLSDLEKEVAELRAKLKAYEGKEEKDEKKTQPESKKTSPEPAKEERVAQKTESAEEVIPKKALVSLKKNRDAANEKIDISRLPMRYCPRMKVKALQLPCGERKECWDNGRCNMVPEGMKMPSELSKKSKEDDYSIHGLGEE